MRVFPDAGDPDKCDLQSILHAVFQVYMDAHAGGDFWINVGSTADGAVRKILLVIKLSKFQPQEIRAKVAALTQWRRWLKNSAWHDLSWFAPSPACFGAALEQAAARRPAAPRWNTHVGLRSALPCYTWFAGGRTADTFRHINLECLKHWQHDSFVILSVLPR